MHFSLRHLAAKMLSQLYHNFFSFPYFFPSYKTCNILAHNIHITDINNSEYNTYLQLLISSSSFIFQQHLARE